MKLVLYNDFQLGVLQGNTVIPVGDSVADLGHHNAQEMMQMIITDWEAIQPKNRKCRRRWKWRRPRYSDFAIAPAPARSTHVCRRQLYRAGATGA